MPDKLQLKVTIAASPETLRHAWMTSAEHAAMSGGGAKIGAKVGAKFQAWDGYISGVTLELAPLRIVQSWRTTEFPAEAPDSHLVLEFRAAANGTELLLVHTEIPAGQGPKYRDGWKHFYFEPMKAFFATKKPAAKKPAAKKPAAKKPAAKKPAAKKPAAKKR